MSMVEPAMRSSSVQVGLYQGSALELGEAVPKVERPRARRKIWSMWARAAVVAGEDVGGSFEVREVDVLGKGAGMCVAMNMWYVWTAARTKRQLRGMTGRPRRRVRFWSMKACLVSMGSETAGKRGLRRSSSPW